MFKTLLKYFNKCPIVDGSPNYLLNPNNFTSVHTPVPTKYELESLYTITKKSPSCMSDDEFAIYKKVLYFYLVNIQRLTVDQANVFLLSKSKLSVDADIDSFLRNSNRCEYIPIDKCMALCRYK